MCALLSDSMLVLYGPDAGNAQAPSARQAIDVVTMLLEDIIILHLA